MKIWIFPLAVCCSTAHAQGAFQNLNFESAIVQVAAQSEPIAVSQGLPGWSYSGQLFYDTLALSSPVVAINDENTGFGFQPLQGEFSAYIAGRKGFSEAISQTGLVPANANSILIEVQTIQYSLGITFSGQNINMVPLLTTPSYTLYGGNISAFAGQDVNLQISEPNGPSLNIATIDDIIFLNKIVPEPQMWTLLSGSIIATLVLRSRRSR